MQTYLTSLDIAKRACDHVGAKVIGSQGFNENSTQAQVFGRIYDKLRQAELEANSWRFSTRRVTLRAIDTNTMRLSPTLWTSTTTYFIGSIVADANGQIWISNTADNLNLEPETTNAWDEYFGPLAVALWDTTGKTPYDSGELVYTTPGDGTTRTYLSLISGNTDTPSTASAWSATTTYLKNQVITYLSVAYMSLIDNNLNQTPNTSPSAWTTTFVGGAGSVNWLEIGGAEFPNGVVLDPLRPLYPIGAGPSSQPTTRNVFLLPANHLRRAPQAPKVGGISVLGAQSGLIYNDWEYNGDYLVTLETGPIIYRFIADTIDVTRMDAMFCEGLAARMGLEGCEPITQSTDKMKAIAAKYERAIDAAKLKNAIEVGSEEPALDDWISCRA